MKIQEDIGGRLDWNMISPSRENIEVSPAITMAGFVIASAARQSLKMFSPPTRFLWLGGSPFNARRLGVCI
jgi:hypothetical protein